MVMPLPSHLRLPSPPEPSQATAVRHPRSPIKKHLHERMTTSDKLTKSVAPTKKKLGSPQKLKAATVAAQVSVLDGVPATGTATGIATGTATGSRLRAATLQAVLGLVDRDDAALQQLLPLLHTLASLPLDNERVRRQCSALLQQLQAPPVSTATDGSSVASTRLPDPQRATTRDSGRAKSGVSLRHCRTFLLACANEIHELEEVNPCFDYAEETGSEMAAVRTRRSGPISLLRQRVVDVDATVDYASLADAASSVFTSQCDPDDELDYDDALADTGSQLSELLFRTCEAEQADREATAAVFHAWRAATTTRRPASHQRAMLRRAFAALKKQRAASALSRQRKQRAFGKLKALLVPAATTAAAERATTTTRTMVAAPPSTMARVVTRMLVHWDVVVLLAIACFVQLTRLS